jgi:hypothetical protein
MRAHDSAALQGGFKKKSSVEVVVTGYLLRKAYMTDLNLRLVRISNTISKIALPADG